MRAAVNRRTGGYLTQRSIRLIVILIILFCLASPTIVKADEDDLWVNTGSLNTGRVYFSALLLTNGKVLVPGGTTASAVVKTAELFDPVAGTWSYTGEMKSIRAGYGAVELADNTVLVVGGFLSQSAATNSAEIYHPVTGTWEYTNGVLSTTLAFPAVTRLQDGKVLITGGLISSSTATNATYLYDPDTGSFSSAGSMNAVRVYHTSTLLPNGKVLITGGSSTLPNAINTIDLYDPETGTWASAASLQSMNQARHSHTTTLLEDGRVLVTGGTSNMDNALNSAELYDPASGSWSVAGTMVTGRYFHTANILPDGRVLAIGGSNNSGAFLSSAEIYTPSPGSAGTWSATLPMANPRMYHTATIFNTYYVLVTGGTSDGSTPRSNSQYYDGRKLASITLTDPVEDYTGGRIEVVVETNPPGLKDDVLVTYTGSDYGPTPIAPILVGTYNVTASLRTTDYRADATGTLTINKAANVITVDSIPANATYQQQFTVAAHADSGGPVTYSSGNPSVCTNAGATFTMVSGTGTCPVQMDQAGNDNYLPATRVTQNVTAQKAANVITVDTPAPASKVYNTSFTVAAHATSGGPVTYSSGNPSVCTNAGATFTMVSGTGTCPVQMDQAGNDNYLPADRLTRNVTAEKAEASVTISESSKNQIYDGTAKPVEVVTDPPGLDVIVEYVGIAGTDYPQSTDPPSAKGTYGVTADINDANYLGSAPGVLTISDKQPGFVYFEGVDLNQTYDGNPKPVRVTTSPPGLTVVVTYSGTANDGTGYGPSPNAPVKAGSYEVLATIHEDEPRAGGGVANLFISKAEATVNIGDLFHTFDGSPKTVTVTTVPSGLKVTLTYKGINGTQYSMSSDAPSQIGTYEVVATVDDTNYQGTVTKNMQISDETNLYLPAIVR